MYQRGTRRRGVYQAPSKKKRERFTFVVMRDVPNMHIKEEFVRGMVKIKACRHEGRNNYVQKRGVLRHGAKVKTCSTRMYKVWTCKEKDLYSRMMYQ